MGFLFHTKWVPGAQHKVADALSRAPVSEPSPEDLEDEEELCYGSSSVLMLAVERLGE